MGRVRTTGLHAMIASLALAGLPAFAAFALTVATEREAAAKPSPDEALAIATGEFARIDAELPAALSIKKKGTALRSAEQMIADGDLLFRLRDYSRAILVFAQVQEKYPENKPAWAEAVYRGGEALYATRDYLSARTKFRLVADRSKEPEFRPYASRAIARLVDVAMRVDDPKDPKSSDEVLARIASLSATEIDSTILYAKGKALYFKKDLDAAKATLQSVGADGGFQHQARFILGVIALKQSQPGKYQTAIDAFSKVTELPGDTDDHKEVVDLAWIAIGRLFYEMDQLDRAVLAYQHVDKASKHFDTYLYEIAWVYVRQEDQDKATRALDLLSLASPDGPYAIEGELLKADILLRKADFKGALETYEKVRDQLDPMRKRLDDYLGSGRTPAEYYDKLTSTNFDAFDGPDALPPIVVKWAKEQEDGALAFGVVDSVQQTKELLGEAYDMLEKLQLVVHGPNKLKAVPELRPTYEKTLALANRVAKARAQLGEALDDVEPVDVGGYPELFSVREQRRRLQKQILGLPVDDAGFQRREDEAVGQWRGLSQQLQQRNVEIDMLQAQVNALRRYVKTKTTDSGSTIPPAQLEEYRTRLDEAENEVKGLRHEAAVLRKQVEAGKVQVGVGDTRFQQDAQARDEYRDLLDKEIGLVQAQLGGDARSFATRAAPVLARARATEDRARSQLAGIDAEVDKHVAGIRAQLDAEAAALDAYKDQLAKFDDEARLVVGEVAKRNFGLVRDKLTTLVMRAEVGIVDQAWNEREVRKLILRDRQVEMKEAERLLDDELRQITNDGAGFE
jgi:tetratricopeptide (TPR) repeat protein